MTSHFANYPDQPDSNEEMLDALQRNAFAYFLHETNPLNGLVADKTQSDTPASIAAVGFALATDAALPLRRHGITACGIC